MSEHLALTRRQFVQSSLVITSTLASAPAFLRPSAQALDARPRRPGPAPADAVLVVVQLSGGNDGLNTVVPYTHDDYYRARPTLAIPQADVLKLDARADVGLHPALADLKTLYDEGLLSIVQGVGYPQPNRSHFASMDIWHTADPARGSQGAGWLGKALDQPRADKGVRSLFLLPRVPPTVADAPACICFGQEAPLATQGNLSPPLLLTNGCTAPDCVRHALASGPNTSFPAEALSQQLQSVAAMIRAGLPTRIYYVSLGGFDTHAGQPARHPALLRQFAAAMHAFARELRAIGQDQRVLTLAFSEFGRRVAQNTSAGTDHGAAGPVFLLGPMVAPGLVGQHPSLSPHDLDQGDTRYTTDFRNVYAAVLDGWLSVDSRAVLGQPFAPAPVLL